MQADSEDTSKRYFITPRIIVFRCLQSPLRGTLFYVTDLLMNLALSTALLVFLLIILEKFKQLRLSFTHWEALGQRVGRLLDTTQTPNAPIAVMMLVEHVSRRA